MAGPALDYHARVVNNEPEEAPERDRQDPSRPVITLFESSGAGAQEVGPRLAEILGVPWIDQKFSSARLAEAAERPEDQPGFLAHFFRLLGSANAGPDNAPLPWVGSPDASVGRDNTAEVRRLARDGAVILGRNATVILADRPNSLHVKLDAPPDARVRRALADSGLSAEEALHRLAREDVVRAEMSLRLYEWDPRTTAAYDLVLNTEAFGLDACVRLILAALAERRAR